MPFLEIQDIRVNYGQVEALRGASLHVDEGETVAIVGANGAGKTTLINAISGLNPLASGKIMFEGQLLGDLQPHRLPELGIVQVPEGRRLFARLSVEDNLQLGAYHKRARKDSAKSREAIYDLLPILANRKTQLAGTLSGGQQQMLAIGRALMAKPRLLLLDEPSLGLAPIIVTELFALIKQIAIDGTAVLLVEQNVSRTLEISDRAYAFQQGAVIMTGTGQGLLHDPNLPAAMLGIAAGKSE
jgi:branched-chain amino acid transport system ATP-binding protein